MEEAFGPHLSEGIPAHPCSDAPQGLRCGGSFVLTELVVSELVRWAVIF